MISKVFTIRDQETLGDKEIKIMATRVAATSPAEQQVLEGTPGGAVPGIILLARCDLAEANYDPMQWELGGRAMRVVHQHLAEKWFDLGSGTVLDVESILAPAGQVGPARSGRA